MPTDVKCLVCGTTLLRINGKTLYIPCHRCSKNHEEELDRNIEIKRLEEKDKPIKI